MAYATVSDVERLDGAITFTLNTPVTPQDVAGFLVQTGAELDGILAAQDYVTPVDPTAAPVAFALLKHYNALGANCLAQRAWPDSPNKGDACGMWEKALEMLKAGEVALPDAPVDTEDLQLRVSSGFPDGSPTPFFYRQMRL